MCFPCSHTKEGVLLRNGEMYISDSTNEYKEPAFGDRSYELAEHGDIVWMQYTGLEDKNGKEIYEGDIVRFTIWWFDGSVEQDTAITGIIEYSPKNLSFQLKNCKNQKYLEYTGFKIGDEYYTPFSELNFDEADFEVVGNIHENPELLEDLEVVE